MCVVWLSITSIHICQRRKFWAPLPIDAIVVHTTVPQLFNMCMPYVQTEYNKQRNKCYFIENVK